MLNCTITSTTGQLSVPLIDSYSFEEYVKPPPPMSLWQAVRKLNPMTLQLAFMFGVEILQESINMTIIGWLDDTTALAAVGLAYLIFLIFIMATSFGMNTALETLVSQACGAGQFGLCGRYLNRQRFIMVLWFLPLGCLIWFSEPLLLLAGQDSEVSRICSLFLRLSLPGFICLGLFDATRVFLIAIDQPFATIAIMMIGVPLASVNNFVFVHSLGFGVEGLAYSMSINYFLYFVLLSIYCHFTRNEAIRRAWSLPSKDSL